MRMLRTALAVASLTLALMAFPSASASHEVCGHDNQAVYEDVADTLGGDRQCGTLTDPCFQDNSCPPSCGGGPDSVLTWVIGPIYCVSADAAAPCQGDNEYLIWDVEDTLENPKRPECGSLTDPCFVDNSCYAACGSDEGVITWATGPVYCTASADAAWAPCTGPNEHVYQDVRDTLGGNVQCGSLTDPCFQSGGCGGCGPDLVEWVVGPIYCVSADAAAAVAPCQGPNEYVYWDVRDTLENPKQPECGSLSDPCFVKNQCNGGCGGDGIVTWVIGPIYCAASADAWAPCTGTNEAVLHDVQDTLADPTSPECGSLTNPCFLTGTSCYGCGPDVLEWVIGPIYCV